MDMISGLRSELFRPLATLVIPGLTLVWPWLTLLSVENPSILEVARAHTGLTISVAVLIAVAAGMVLEDLGARIELIWDRMLKVGEEWHQYLSVEEDGKLIAQRYIRSILVRFKFELSMAPALLGAGVALFLLICNSQDWNAPGIKLLAVTHFALSAYLLFESYSSARCLKRTRALVVAAKPRPSG